MKTKQRSIIIIRLCISTVESYLKINCLSNHNKKRGYVESKFPFLVIILCSYIGPFRNWLITALVAPKISPSVPGIFCRIIYGQWVIPGKYPRILMLSLNNVKIIICRQKNTLLLGCRTLK